jgi:hypothetical protein
MQNSKNVTKLRLVEAVQVDQDRLGALYSDMDAANAEEVVCRAMEELALRMAQCERQYRAGDLAALRKSSRSLIAISDQIGMTVLADVARAVGDCTESGDQVALAATLGRLMRTGEGSLTAIWDLQDVTI